MGTKFILSKDRIISVDSIKSIRINGSNLFFVTFDGTFVVSYLSEPEAIEEFYRYYEILSD